MTTLTVTARGQVTVRKDVLQHLGIRPGDKIELDYEPEGREFESLRARQLEQAVSRKTARAERPFFVACPPFVSPIAFLSPMRDRISAF